MDKIYWKDVDEDMGVVEKEEHYETEDGKMIYWHVFESKEFDMWVNCAIINTKRKSVNKS